VTRGDGISKTTGEPDADPGGRTDARRIPSSFSSSWELVTTEEDLQHQHTHTPDRERAIVRVVVSAGEPDDEPIAAAGSGRGGGGKVSLAQTNADGVPEILEVRRPAMQRKRNAVQCNAVQCNAMRCTTMQCSGLQRSGMSCDHAIMRSCDHAIMQQRYDTPLRFLPLSSFDCTAPLELRLTLGGVVAGSLVVLS